ncbi:hypothetical protein PAN31117_04100 [Pandoraea anapnoica]|uniref:Uncharacterized protein n=1 Tax=Pandoraea anapnoica TaxID=2508301 RepID=A0A5E5ADA5_9BURK|nr:hypothetical protein [Pandoraea anapnoica]VVE71574.1 hypothetical protein PAN31117_04100 [Pandoraea anapnoica]
MDSYYTLPWFTRHSVLLAVFLIAILSFHIFLVYAPGFRLNKRGWKLTEYVYLFVGALGLFWAVTNTRVYVAHNMLETADHSARSSYDFVRSDIGSTYVRQTCRTFVKSEYSPPEPAFSLSQRQYDAACEWFKSFAKRMPAQPPASESDFSAILADYHAHPSSSDTEVKDIYSLAESRLNWVLDAYRQREEVKAEAEPSMNERVASVLAPFLLALAIALRITKVSGELRLERRDAEGRDTQRKQ